MSIQPIPQTPQEMERETMQTIRRVCQDIMREVDNDSYSGVIVQCTFLKTQMTRLELLHRNVRPSANGV
jgi:type I restriction-modification system DNA methylase subunit